MGQEVEEPVADDCDEHRRRARDVPARELVGAREEEAPRDDGEKPVRDRVRDEVERGDPRDAGPDLDPLEPEEEERRPEQVDELRRQEERAERSSRRGRLAREADSEVPDEHGGGE